MDLKDYSDYTYKFLKENQNYLWLKSRLLLARTNSSNGKTIVTGSSHALNGIDVYCFEEAINCSMHTQDLYYDYLCMKNILDAGARGINVLSF